MLCASHAAARTFYALADLGPNVCGHPSITHGGVSAALHDDTLGGLAYVLKAEKAAGIPEGPAFTVQLEVSYKAPVPAGAAVLVAATVDRVDGRKMWLASELTTQPDGVVRWTARALFVVPKDWRREAGGGAGVVSEAGVERLARDEAAAAAGQHAA
jgi:acyl-coenzyme A thioesterase PaaI-like protein